MLPIVMTGKESGRLSSAITVVKASLPLAFRLPVIKRSDPAWQTSQTARSLAAKSKSKSGKKLKLEMWKAAHSVPGEDSPDQVNLLFNIVIRKKSDHDFLRLRNSSSRARMTACSGVRGFRLISSKRSRLRSSQ